MQGKVSIVIPIVRNDKHIAECLAHIEKSTYRNYEVIVVDEGKERSYQRNFGIKKATGDFLLWLDSDMMITPGLIEECVRLCHKFYDEKDFVNDEFDALYIPEHIVTKGWFGKLRNWERQFYTGTLVDVVRFVRLPCPLFDENLHGVEDSDWERQLPKNWRFGVTKNHFDHHDKVGLIKYLKKKSYYAECLGKYKSKNPDDKLLTFKYRCWDVFTENGKWKKFFSRPDLAFQVFLLLFVRGVIAKVQEFRYR